MNRERVLHSMLPVPGRLFRDENSDIFVADSKGFVDPMEWIERGHESDRTNPKLLDEETDGPESHTEELLRAV